MELENKTKAIKNNEIKILLRSLIYSIRNINKNLELYGDYVNQQVEKFCLNLYVNFNIKDESVKNNVQSMLLKYEDSCLEKREDIINEYYEKLICFTK